MDLKQKQLAFLDETIDFYDSNNRSVKNSKDFFNCDNVCVYSPTETSPGCAIGRHIEDKALLVKWDVINLPINSDKLTDEIPQHLFDLGVDFLRQVQRLHDDKVLWNEEGLSPRGKAEYERIIKCDIKIRYDK